MEKTEIAEKVQKFMKEMFQLELSHDITVNSDLFKLGVINSYGYIKLLSFLKNEFIVELSEDEVLSNILVTISSIVDCISIKVNKVQT